MSFPGKSMESRLRQANSRFSTVRNMVNSFGKSLSGLLHQRNYSPPPVPPTTPDSVESGEGVIVADVAEVALANAASSSLPDPKPSIAATAGGAEVQDSPSNSAKRKVSQPIPIPRSGANRDQSERAECPERLYI